MGSAASTQGAALLLPAPPSPCINVCRMNDATGWCDGCLRTIDEIAGWSSFDDETKRAVWQAIETRHVQWIARRAPNRGGAS
ncbi:DUF1289 domain-containing protein [Paraburkholderia caballeronis]|uniref:Fe-S protein n=1 Tax=Paraburkholderia caballeronis TaxID=416943 RepID=A0A1H7HMP7_9BURK|nr:DUF1289 domain-containing protein [Paraburkholderia caballeronis]PXW29438.1 hypothetical protein C7403_101291 [Paraburkholderia caballeronis]PXX04697.1 hypothetical protein C7407_101291 [Paraburkholderia caballeronis]RAK05758.1 hypothetical protein C7409_101291 [Paraburkholderia caballeronis]TDV18537.1 hypothetical protein C7408_103294 [Paraburkholderia caballeronis]TDV19925.1 hypothetical protein C7406_103147 [Paraburkholderia caballeronis]